MHMNWISMRAFDIRNFYIAVLLTEHFTAMCDFSTLKWSIYFV